MKTGDKYSHLFQRLSVAITLSLSTCALTLLDHFLFVDIYSFNVAYYLFTMHTIANI